MRIFGNGFLARTRNRKPRIKKPAARKSWVAGATSRGDGAKLEVEMTCWAFVVGFVNVNVESCIVFVGGGSNGGVVGIGEDAAVGGVGDERIGKSSGIIAGGGGVDCSAAGFGGGGCGLGGFLCSGTPLGGGGFLFGGGPLGGSGFLFGGGGDFRYRRFKSHESGCGTLGGGQVGGHRGARGACGSIREEFDSALLFLLLGVVCTGR